MRLENFDYKKSTKESDPVTTVLAVPTALLAIFAYVIIKSYVICLLWLWYVVSYFDVKPMTLPVAFGICLLAQLIMGYKQEKTSKDTLLLLIMPFVTLFFGWVGTFFM